MVKRRPRSMLRAKQNFISDLVFENRHKMIISGMGSGKTAGTLTGMRRLHDLLLVRHTLVLAPLLVAKETWPDEIEAWEHTRAMTYAVAVHKNPKKRAEAIEKRAQITLLNFEALQWLAKYLRTVDNWYWDQVIVDESSRFKAGEERTKRARVRLPNGKVRIRKGGNQTRFGIMKVARKKKIRRTTLLTGTPFPQGVIDAWGQAFVMDMGERLGPTKDGFKEHWFDEDAYTHAITPKDGAEADILSRIEDLMVTLPDEKLVDEPIYLQWPVTLAPGIMSKYRTFARTLYSEEYDVEAVNRGVLANKLLQFANGSMYREDRSIAEIHDEKVRAVEEIAKQAAGENLLIFYSFQFDLERLKRKFPQAVVAQDEPDVIGKWNRGEIPILLAHPATLGHGTNLQYGGHICIWFGPISNLELFEQGSWRLPRPGQEKQVMVYVITARDTYDEKAFDDLTSKGVTQDRLMAHFRVYLENNSRAA